MREAYIYQIRSLISHQSLQFNDSAIAIPIGDDLSSHQFSPFSLLLLLTSQRDHFVRLTKIWCQSIVVCLLSLKDLASVRSMAAVARNLLDSLVTSAEPRDREVEAERARVRAA